MCSASSYLPFAAKSGSIPLGLSVPLITKEHSMRDLQEWETFIQNLGLPPLPDKELQVQIPAPHPLSTPGKIWTPVCRKAWKTQVTPQRAVSSKDPTRDWPLVYSHSSSLHISPALDFVFQDSGLRVLNFPPYGSYILTVPCFAFLSAVRIRRRPLWSILRAAMLP